MNAKQFLNESEINLISEGTRIEGKLDLQKVTRVHGTVVGEIHSPRGGTLIIAESGMVEGTLHVDTLLIDGCIVGNITAGNLVFINSNARVIGDIRSPAVKMEHGAYFEGKLLTDARKK